MKKPLEILSWQKFNSKASGRNTGTPFFKGSKEALAGAGVSPVPLNRFPFLEEEARGWLARISIFHSFLRQILA
jgi:hypothetical protein